MTWRRNVRAAHGWKIACRGQCAVRNKRSAHVCLCQERQSGMATGTESERNAGKTAAKTQKSKNAVIYIVQL